MESDRDDKSAFSRSSSSDSREVEENYPEFGQGGARKRTGQLPGLLPLVLKNEAASVTHDNNTHKSCPEEQPVALAGAEEEWFHGEILAEQWECLRHTEG